MSTFNAYLLEDNFNAARLPEGRWATISGTPAFDDAYAAVLDGTVQELGVTYDDEGTAMLVFSTERARGNGQRVRRNSDDLLSGELQQVKVNEEDLIKEVQKYSAWKMAWWREAVQNGVDARATHIQLYAKEIDGDPEGNWLVSCQDDGTGMTPEIIINKFLTRFGSTKGGYGSTGGFGEAKKLLLFTWKKWRIYSQNAMVEGTGEIFRPTRVDSYLSGTRIESMQPAAEHTTLAHAIEFVKRCYLPNTRITYTDDAGRSQRIAPNPKANVSGLTPIRETGTVRIYFIKNKRDEEYKSRSVWIRVHNAGLGTSLFMFDRPLSNETDGQVIVEIVGKSVDILTANRDGFRQYTEALKTIEDFIQELAKDPRSAVKPRNPGFTKTYSKGYRERASLPDIDLPYGGDFKDASESAGQNKLNGRGVKALLDQVAQAAEKAEESGGYGGSVGSEAYKTLSGLGQTADLAESILEDLQFASDVELKRSVQQLKWQPDFIVINEIEGFDSESVLRSPLKKFYPEEMTPTIARLARVWMELCRWVLMQLRCDAEWGIGFVFSTDTGAAYSRRKGLHWLLLNPIDLSNSLAKTLIEDVSESRSPKSRLEDLEILRVTDRNDFKWLYAAAIHEATHFADGLDYHDEAFSSALTKNIAKCADGMLFYSKILQATASRRAPRTPKAAKAAKVTKATQKLPARSELDELRKIAIEISENPISSWDDRERAEERASRFFEEFSRVKSDGFGGSNVQPLNLNPITWDNAIGSSFRPTTIKDKLITEIAGEIWGVITEQNNADESGVALIFDNCVFVQDIYNNAMFKYLDFTRVDFRNCYFVGVDFQRCTFSTDRTFTADSFSGTFYRCLVLESSLGQLAYVDGRDDGTFPAGEVGRSARGRWSQNVIDRIENHGREMYFSHISLI